MNYFETSQQVIESIDVERLVSMRPSQTSGRGSSFHFRPLGKIEHKNSNMNPHVGLKIANDYRAHAEPRLLEEMALLQILAGSSKNFKECLPSFMGLITCKELGGVVGILTEDVSRGGEVSVTKSKASDDLKNRLYEPFSHLGRFHDVVSVDSVEDSASFDVAGTEMILDMTPPPINHHILSRHRTYLDIFDRIYDQIGSISIEVPKHSALGQELRL